MQALHSVQLSLFTTSAPKGAPAGSAILLGRLLRVLGQMVEREIERGALLGDRLKVAGLRRRRGGLQRPEPQLERVRPRDQREVFPRVTEPAGESPRANPICVRSAAT